MKKFVLVDVTLWSRRLVFKLYSNEVHWILAQQVHDVNMYKNIFVVLINFLKLLKLKINFTLLDKCHIFHVINLKLVLTQTSTRSFP